MIIRLGIPGGFTTLGAHAHSLGAPILISANAFNSGGGLRVPKRDLFGAADHALDSAGFVAQMLYGGYPWSCDAYGELVAAIKPTWWAARDYCCEPEIASSPEIVRERIERTVASLVECMEMAVRRGLQPPMPVLQGWAADDYQRCADLMGELPEFVGLGSVCRRKLSGAAGLLAIIEHLDRRLPKGVRLHLFGVKGQAIEILAGHPRIKSVDSMAWDSQARKLQLMERRASGQRKLPRGRAKAIRLAEMTRWWGRQRRRLGRGAPLLAGLAA